MTFQTETVKHETPYAFSDKPGWESSEPILEIGDRVTITGYWDSPIQGVIVDKSEKGLLCVNVPIATPGGVAVLSRSFVTEAERNSEIWMRKDA
jgi:hypothetical protein